MEELDFSELHHSRGDYPDGITQSEIVSVLENSKHRLQIIDGYPPKEFYNMACGYSKKKRILLIVSRIVDLKRQILQVKVADENEIDDYYCQG